MDGDQSVWKSIFRHLKGCGFEVYPPGTKSGECTSKYVVIKNGGSSQHASVSTDVDLYDVMCYVPQNCYSGLEPFVQSVKISMVDMYPMVQPHGIQTPSYFDDKVKGHTISITYRNYKKIIYSKGAKE